jgi:hypothetical protein
MTYARTRPAVNCRPTARPTPGARGGPGDVAQLGERLPCKQQASGSIPLISTEPPGAAIAEEEDFLHGSMGISFRAIGRVRGIPEWWVAREYGQRHEET